ncbi:MAG: hypothetical protein QM767_06955 [Anaeromyxobacter sp.]
MAGQGGHHHGIRGSAALATQAVAPLPPEALRPGEMRRLPYAGELLGAVRVRAGFAPIPLDAFDQAAAQLEIEEQAAYLQLLRLSCGEGRNWCRAGKRDLMARLRLSERRLLRVLDALVAKGFARPLHRDNRGTLWRVFLPSEAAGEAVGDEVLLGRAVLPAEAGAPAASPAPDPVAPAVRAGPRAARPQRTDRAPRLDPRAALLAERLAAARGQPGPEGVAAAGRENRRPAGRGAAAGPGGRRRGDRLPPRRRGGEREAMSRTRTAFARIALAPATPAPSGPGAVDQLRERLAGSTAREHVVLDFLEDDLREARAALAAVAAYVANVEAALADASPSQQRLLSLVTGGGPSERVEYLQTVLASARRRLAQVAARM